MLQGFIGFNCPIQTFLPCKALTLNNMPTVMKKNGPVNPSNATNFVPQNLIIGLLKRSLNMYILGTMISVKKNEKINPKIIVQLKGPQNTTLSPPKKRCGFKCWNKETKSIFKPTASGN